MGRLAGRSAAPTNAALAPSLSGSGLARVRRAVLSWYRAHRRDLPWRRHPDLYRTLLSEFMLQQTRVEQALPYYARFLEAFPRLEDLAAAPPDRILKLWEGLGYYHRARNLHRTAQRLAALERPGAADLLECPGVGPYTRAAITSIVWGGVLPVVDGNVNRVLARILALEAPPASPAGKAAIHARAAAWIAPEAPGAWNQGLMELGATVCTPKHPRCGDCPLRPWCLARARGLQDELPRRLPKPPRPHRLAAAGVVHGRAGRILIAQRPAAGLLPGLWEFPGGERRGREALAVTCARAIREQLSIAVKVGAKLAVVSHGYSHFTVTLHVFACRYSGGPLSALGCQAWRWVRPAQLRGFAFPRVHHPVLEQLCPGPVPHFD